MKTFDKKTRIAVYIALLCLLDRLPRRPCGLQPGWRAAPLRPPQFGHRKAVRSRSMSELTPGKTSL